MGRGAPPGWVSRLAYAGEFHIEPQAVNPKILWWYRWQEWEYAQEMKRARLEVEKSGLGNVSTDTRRLYDELVLNYGKR